VIEAIDYQTGKIRWSHEVGPGGSGAGVMTTDSGLTFTGDAFGNVLALNTGNGKTLCTREWGADAELAYYIRTRRAAIRCDQPAEAFCFPGRFRRAWRCRHIRHARKLAAGAAGEQAGWVLRAAKAIISPEPMISDPPASMVRPGLSCQTR